MKLREKVYALHRLNHPQWQELYQTLLPEDKKWLNQQGIYPVRQLEMNAKVSAKLVGFRIIDRDGYDVTAERMAKK